MEKKIRRVRPTVYASAQVYYNALQLELDYLLLTLHQAVLTDNTAERKAINRRLKEIQKEMKKVELVL